MQDRLTRRRRRCLRGTKLICLDVGRTKRRPARLAVPGADGRGCRAVIAIVNCPRAKSHSVERLFELLDVRADHTLGEVTMHWRGAVQDEDGTPGGRHRERAFLEFRSHLRGTICDCGAGLQVRRRKNDRLR